MTVIEKGAPSRAGTPAGGVDYAEAKRLAADADPEARERLARLRLQLLGQDELVRRRHQRDPAGTRVAVDELHRRFAEAALRRVDDALEGEVVGRVRGRPEVGESVADLQLDIVFIDVSTGLQPEDFFPLDGHFRPSGHEKVAAVLAAAIDSGGVPAPENPRED